MGTTILRQTKQLVTTALHTIKTSRLSYKYPFGIPIVERGFSKHKGSTRVAHPLLKYAAVLLLVFSIGVGEVWGAATLVSSLSGISSGETYYIAALNSSNYYTVPNTTICEQTFTCTLGTYNSTTQVLTPATGAGEFVFTAKAGTDNAYYIYNTNLKKYLVATGSKTFGYVESSSSDYGYWTFSTVEGGGFSGVFSVKHSNKTHYMRAYSNAVKCYDGASNSGIYLFQKSSGYSITYHCNGATSDCPSNASSQTALPNPLPTPTRTGCTFAGWYTNEGLTTAATAGATLSANADLYAKWTTNVTLNRNDATETINNVVVGTDLDDIDGTSAQGGCSEWTFVGWSKTQRAAQNNSTAMTLVTEVDGPGPYYAVYSHTESGGGSSSGNETITLSSGSFSTDHIDWSGTSCTITQTQGSSSTAVSSNYVSAPRVYKGHILSFVANTNYTITKIEIEVNSTYYGNSMTAGTAISGTTVTDNTTDVGRSWTSTSGGTHEITSTDDDGLSAIYIQNVASASNVQLRLTGIKVYYIVSGGSTTYYSTTASCCTQLGSINGSIK